MMIFHHFTARLGIEQAESMLLPSPFDYTRCALLCVRVTYRKLSVPGAARQLAAKAQVNIISFQRAMFYASITP